MREVTARISLENAYLLYKRNLLFKQYLQTGYYVYWPMGVIHTVVEFRATGAPDHLEFEYQSPSSHELGSDKGTDWLQQFAADIEFSTTEWNGRTLKSAECYMARYKEEHLRKAARYTSANDIMLEYMQEKHWNATIFREKTLLSAIDYSRLLDPNHIFKLQAYVAMAVGLHLTVPEFQTVISRAGLCLVDGREPDDAYAFILSVLSRRGIDTCNDFLRAIGLSPLGTRERDGVDTVK